MRTKMERYNQDNSAKQDEDNGVATQEPNPEKKRKRLASIRSQVEGRGGCNVHLAHEAILVHTLPLAALGLFSPHLLDILQHHVTVSVKGLDAGQQLAVVPAGDQDLGVRAGGGLQKGQRAGGELMLLDQSDFVLPVRICGSSVSICMPLLSVHAWGLCGGRRYVVHRYPQCGHHERDP